MTIKEMLILDFQTIIPAHLHEKLAHPFPERKNKVMGYWYINSTQITEGKKKSVKLQLNVFTVTTNHKSLWSLLTLFIITSICVFFILFFIHSLRWWHGEFFYQSRASLVGDNLLYPRILVTSVIQKWSRAKNLDASHSKGPKREKKPRVSCVNRKIGVF